MMVFFRLKPNKASRFLGKVHFENMFFLFDYWMIVHFFSGVILGLFFSSALVVFVLLVVYEIFEIVLRGVLFEKERLKNIVWDLVFGMAGFFVITNLMLTL